MNAKDTLKLISKQWCNVHDMEKLTGFAQSKSFEVMKMLKDKLLEQGYLLPRGVVPMCEVVKLLKIDINYLESMEKNN